ncbi:MAG: HEAT repeat domain-containing protein [Deltaproteobacteria bacterium]|uniref:HEAT repeat domain-containing protein n=1 Tax=Candidatus Zymogenus saltonus TaxID=2844893 RepID=A0A9D8PPX4_9DELT|nr:HEAT repeat domain-containing protein [Candidatus Zymogenus saltonus]
MAKEFISIILFFIVTAGGLAGVFFSWRIESRPKRGAVILAALALYIAVSCIIARWAGSGGWPEGMIALPVIVVVGLPVALLMLIALILALFAGGKPSRIKRAVLVTLLSLIGIALLTMIFNRPIRTMWYLKDVDNPNPVTRRLAVIMVGEYGTKRVLPVLLKAAGDKDSGVRESAVFGMMSLGDPEAAPAVRRALKDESPEVRRAAAYCVVSVARGQPWLLEELLPLLADPDESVREAAISSLDAVDADWRKRPEVPPEYRVDTK